MIFVADEDIQPALFGKLHGFHGDLDEGQRR